METFLAFLKEILKGVVRAISAYIFQKTFLKDKKTTRRAASKRVVLETKYDNRHADGEGCKKEEM